MKTLLVKSILPVAAFVLASAGALSTNSSNTGSKLVPVQGFRQTATGCQFVKLCNNVGGITCEDSMGNQLYGKPTPAADCTDILFHRP